MEEETKKEQLEFWGNTRFKIGSEGLGYYITSYESPSTFDKYPDVKEKFEKAQTALREFENAIDEKIRENGGNPDEFEA